MYGGFADFEQAVADEAAKLPPFVPQPRSTSEDNTGTVMSDLLGPYSGPLADLTKQGWTPTFGSEAGLVRIRCEHRGLETLGPGVIVEAAHQAYPRWPRFVSMATLPAEVLPGIVTENATPIQKKKQSTNGHSTKEAG